MSHRSCQPPMTTLPVLDVDRYSRPQQRHARSTCQIYVNVRSTHIPSRTYSPNQPKKHRRNPVDFKIPKDLQDYLDELDQFIEKEIMPIQNRDDNVRFFDHRREHSRTDWDNNGLPRKEWEALLAE